MSDDDDDHAPAAHADRERIRAAVHFAQGRLCESLEKPQGVDFSKAAIAALAEVANVKLEYLVRDSAAFCR